MIERVVMNWKGRCIQKRRIELNLLACRSCPVDVNIKGVGKSSDFFSW